MTVDDTTTGQSQSRTVKYRSKGLSAEAIHERPCLGLRQHQPRPGHLGQDGERGLRPRYLQRSRSGRRPVTAATSPVGDRASLTEIVMEANNRPGHRHPVGPRHDPGRLHRGLRADGTAAALALTPS